MGLHLMIAVLKFINFGRCDFVSCFRAHIMSMHFNRIFLFHLLELSQDELDWDEILINRYIGREVESSFPPFHYVLCIYVAEVGL